MTGLSHLKYKKLERIVNKILKPQLKKNIQSALKRVSTRQRGGDITNDVTSTLSLGASVINNSKFITETIIKSVVKITDSLIPVLQDAIFGDLADKPWNEVAPELTEYLKKDKELIQNILNDPELRAAMEELVQTYAGLAIEMIQLLQPEIDMMTEQLWETISETANKSAIGVVNTVFNTVEAAVGEIPVVGGGIDLIVAIVRGINHAMQAAAPAIQFGTTTLGTTYSTGKRLYDTANKGIDQINNAKNKLNNTIERVSNIKKNPIINFPPVPGTNTIGKIDLPRRAVSVGGYKNPYKKIMKATRKRISKSLKLFNTTRRYNK